MVTSFSTRKLGGKILEANVWVNKTKRMFGISLKPSCFTLLSWFSRQRGIKDVHVESGQGEHTLHLVSGPLNLREFSKRRLKYINFV